MYAQQPQQQPWGGATFTAAQQQAVSPHPSLRLPQRQCTRIVRHQMLSASSSASLPLPSLRPVAVSSFVYVCRFPLSLSNCAMH